jgi:hypothetical protein
MSASVLHAEHHTAHSGGNVGANHPHQFKGGGVYMCLVIPTIRAREVEEPIGVAGWHGVQLDVLAHAVHGDVEASPLDLLEDSRCGHVWT